MLFLTQLWSYAISFAEQNVVQKRYLHKFSDVYFAHIELQGKLTPDLKQLATLPTFDTLDVSYITAKVYHFQFFSFKTGLQNVKKARYFGKCNNFSFTLALVLELILFASAKRSQSSFCSPNANPKSTHYSNRTVKLIVYVAVRIVRVL